MANEEAMRRVGANLKRARKNKGLTQEELASLIPGQSKPQISAYENGKRDVPRDKVERFAEVLGISPMSLIPLEESSRPEEPELNEKEPTVKEVSDRLRSIRISKGLKVADMTKLLNISDRGYRYYESNEREPDIERLIKICRILSVSADELLGITGDDELRKEPTMISNHLKEIRKGMGISMRQMAMNLDMPYTTYVSYEKGEREPNIAGLIKLADYFGCTVDYLVRGEAPRTIPEAARDHIMQRFCNTV